MAYYKDRVVKIDYELAAIGIFTRLYSREIDPPQDTAEVDVKKIAEALLLAAHQIADTGAGSSSDSVPGEALEITLDRVLSGTSLRKKATIFIRAKLWAALNLHIKKLSVQISRGWRNLAIRRT